METKQLSKPTRKLLFWKGRRRRVFAEWRSSRGHGDCGAKPVSRTIFNYASLPYPIEPTSSRLSLIGQSDRRILD